MKKPKFIFHNLPYKILALFIALFLWFFSAKDRIIIETIELPIKTVNLDNNLVISKIKPAKVPFLVKAKVKTILKLKKEGLFYKLDLTDFKKGNYIHNINTKNIIGTDNLSSFSIKKNEETIFFSIDEKVIKIVPIVVKYLGTPPKNYGLIGKIKATPPYVKIRGPKSVTAIYSFPIDISKITTSLKKEIVLNLPKNTQILDKVSTYFAHINIARLKKIKIQVPLSISGNYSLIYPKKISLKIELPEFYSIKIAKNNIKASIDVTNYKKGNYDVFPKITLPKDFSLIDFEPKTIRVIIDNK